jgi:hypothetical protein
VPPSKERINKMKRQPIEWEKIFLSHSTNKGLISRIYKEHKKFNSKRTNNPINKWVNKLNRQFSEENQIANKYIKEMFNIFSHDANQSHTKDSISPCQAGHHQENK